MPVTMALCALLLSYVVMVISSVTSSLQSQPKVTIQDGRLQGATVRLTSVPSLYGSINASIDVFRGIPYAGPPTGMCFVNLPFTSLVFC